MVDLVVQETNQQELLYLIFSFKFQLFKFIFKQVTQYRRSSMKRQQCYKCFAILQDIFCLAHPKPVPANTTISVARSHYCMHRVTHCHSNLATTPSSCIPLTLASFFNQNLTCSTPSPLSSFYRIPFILGKLKSELTKNPLHHACKNGSIPGETTCLIVERMGNILLGRISMATLQRGTSSHITPGNVLNTHVHLMTTDRWTSLMDPASQELTRVTLKGGYLIYTQPHGS